MGSTYGRSAAQSSTDPRAERTRHEIFSAVERLAAGRTASVSVTDIVQAAGISRSSFYAHFASLDELVTALLNAQFEQIGWSGIELRREDCITGAHAARIGYRRLIAHMVEHYPLYSTVLALPVARSAYDRIVEAYARQLLETVVTVSYLPAGVAAETVTTYVAGGVLTVISSWMRGDLDASDDELVEQLVDMLPSWLVEPRT